MKIDPAHNIKLCKSISLALLFNFEQAKELLKELDKDKQLEYL